MAFFACQCLFRLLLFGSLRLLKVLSFPLCSPTGCLCLFHPLQLETTFWPAPWLCWFIVSNPAFAHQPPAPCDQGRWAQPEPPSTCAQNHTGTLTLTLYLTKPHLLLCLSPRPSYSYQSPSSHPICSSFHFLGISLIYLPSFPSSDSHGLHIALFRRLLRRPRLSPANLSPRPCSPKLLALQV